MRTKDLTRDAQGPRPGGPASVALFRASRLPGLLLASLQVQTGRYWMSLLAKLDWASKLNVAAILASLVLVGAIVIGIF